MAAISSNWMTNKQYMPGKYGADGSITKTRENWRQGYDKADLKGSRHRYWSPDSVRADMLSQGQGRAIGKTGRVVLSDKSVNAEWKKRNIHADKYRNDLAYRKKWDKTHGGINKSGGKIDPFKVAFNAFVGGQIAGGAMGTPMVGPGGAAGGGAAGGGAAGGTSGGFAAANTSTGLTNTGASLAGNELVKDIGTSMGMNELSSLGTAALGSMGQQSGSSRDRKIAQEMISKGRDRALAEHQPFRDAGINALAQYQEGMGDQTGMYDQFRFNMENDPGYNFQRDEALGAAERAMASRGYNNSGNLYNELARRASGMAAANVDSQFNRQLAQHGADAARNREIYGRDQGYLNRLSGLTGMGQQAATNMANTWTGSQGSRANVRVGGALANQQGNQFMAESANNALQGYFENNLLEQVLANYKRGK